MNNGSFIYSLNHWEHEITFNCKKSFGMLLSPKDFSLSHAPLLQLGGSVITFADSVKCLDVLLENSLSDESDISRQICWHLEHSLAPNVLLAWQVRLARSYLLSSSTSTDESTELMLAVTAQLGKVFDNFVSENKQLVEAVTSNRRMEASRILTRSQSFHDTEQYLVDISGLPKLKQLASYLVYNSIQLRLSSNLPTSSTKRRSRHKNDDSSLTSALLRLKQLKDLDLPTATCLKVL